MTSRRTFLQNVFMASSAGILAGCGSLLSSPSPAQRPNTAKPSNLPAPRAPEPPPDLFSAELLDKQFWQRPRTLHLYRPATKESAKVLYWEDGQMDDKAYQRLCHILRDVNGRATTDIDPKLLELLWGTQAFVKKFGGVTSPIEVLSGYRTPASNKRLQEKGIPAARKSLHMEGKAADIRIPNLDPGVLGNLIKSFKQGGVGFYYRPNAAGGWIHVDTGLRRTWRG